MESDIVAAVKKADASTKAVTARIGTARAPELLHDAREPQVKHDELVVLSFLKPRVESSEPGANLAGLIVQWNCHPETLNDKNTELSADYVAATGTRVSESVTVAGSRRRSSTAETM